jgi:large subunit ribosomal protein L25
MPVELKAQVRPETGTRNMVRLRRQGRIPAVVYGGEARDATAVSVDGRELSHLLHAGQRVLTLKYGDRSAEVLIKAIQFDPLGEQILHVDFNTLRAGQKVRVRVPVSVKGTPKGQADGGVLSHVLHELEVECLPGDIPERVVADVEKLAKGDALHVGELSVPEGVTVLTKAGNVVAACIEPRVEEVAAPAPAEAAALEPEVITEKKEAEAAPPAEGEGKKPAEQKKKEAK